VKTRPVLIALARAIADECDINAPFRSKVEAILQPKREQRKPKDRIAMPRRGRRAPAALDPVAVVQEGFWVLRERLERLDLEQLKDIVAHYGMDPSKLVMKWKDRERVIERILDISQTRSTKGDAFRG
jgi:hypothetical protein